MSVFSIDKQALNISVNPNFHLSFIIQKLKAFTYTRVESSKS